MGLILVRFDDSGYIKDHIISLKILKQYGIIMIMNVVTSHFTLLIMIIMNLI